MQFFTHRPHPISAPTLQPPTAGRALTAAVILQDVERCKAAKWMPECGENKRSSAVQPAGAPMQFFTHRPHPPSAPKLPTLQPPSAGRALTAAAILQDVARCKCR